MGTVVDNSPFILYTEFHSFKIFFRYVHVFSWPDFITCHVEYILACHILISEKKIVSVTRKVEKYMKFHVLNIWRVVHNLPPF